MKNKEEREKEMRENAVMIMAITRHDRLRSLSFSEVRQAITGILLEIDQKARQEERERVSGIIKEKKALICSCREQDCPRVDAFYDAVSQKPRQEGK